MKKRIMLLVILCVLGSLWGCKGKEEAMLLESAGNIAEASESARESAPAQMPESAGNSAPAQMPESAGNHVLPESGGTGSTPEQGKLSGAAEKDTTPEPAHLYVHVCGAVAVPGVYELDGGSRICDALDMAGGFSDEACEEYINLAQLLSDGQKIYIPTMDEVQAQKQSDGTALWEGIEQRGSADALREEEPESTGRINLNTATKEQLMTLPGIGASKAERILAYRKEHGGFSCAEDITMVAGIKEATFSQIREYIIVE